MYVCSHQIIPSSVVSSCTYSVKLFAPWQNKGFYASLCLSSSRFFFGYSVLYYFANFLTHLQQAAHVRPAFII